MEMVRLARRIEDSSVGILSVDCFDTLLLRNCKPDLERFSQLSKRLSALPMCLEYGCDSKAIFQSRIHATEIAYRTAQITDGGREARHEDVLKIQLSWLGMGCSGIKEFRRVEAEFESEMVRPNVALVSLCKDAVSMGKKLVIASDMYLDAEAIGHLLRAHRLDGIFSGIYVSSEHMATKRGGGLFRCIAETEGEALSSILHLGDMYRADYVMPKSLGMQAWWLPRHLAWRAASGFRSLLAYARYRSQSIAP